MEFIPPQLLTAAREAPAGERWLHEPKLDGYRLLAQVEDGRVRLYSRRGSDLTPRLAPIIRAVAELGSDRLCVDGELVAIGSDGLPDFDLLHRAMRGGRRAPPLLFYAFDLLRLDGRSLLSVDVLRRKERLRALLDGASPQLMYVDHHVGSGPELHAQAHALGIEGLVSKRVGSVYRPGCRARTWLKVKCYREYTFVVARTTHDGVAVVDAAGASAGVVPVYSARRRASLAAGEVVRVKALAWRPGRSLRHATLLD